MNTLTLSDKVEMVVYDIYMSALETSPEESSLFRKLLMVDLNGSRRLLMVAGATHQYYQTDNSCVAVLNPDRSLLREIHPGCYYDRPELLGIVQDKCDFALGLMIDTCSGFRASPYFEYTSRPTTYSRFNYLGYGDRETLTM